MKLVLKRDSRLPCYTVLKKTAIPLYVAFPYSLYIKDLVLSQCGVSAQCVSGCTRGCCTRGLLAGLAMPLSPCGVLGCECQPSPPGSHVGAMLVHLYPLSHMWTCSDVSTVSELLV